MHPYSSNFCADDWGLSPGVNAGILELARKQLLFSVSCLANSTYLADGLLELLSYEKDGLQFHIHFNLTYGHSKFSHAELPSLTSRSGAFFDVKTLMIKALMRQVAPEEYENTFLQQMKILKDYGIPISGLDGHHHVHLLPSVYSAIKKLLPQNGIKRVRTMIDPQHMMSFLQSAYFKKFVFDSSVGLNLLPCGYVLTKNLKSSRLIKEKLNLYQHMIVHPAKFNDFKFVGMNDKLQEGRLTELKLLLEYLS
ncbi:MAG: ChbG/HpnK family deacetylase [Bacteriovorax sp.]|nr:ChbG/HpnK family deacetylase [Bacteriovorax sp.]